MSREAADPPVDLDAARAVARDCGWSLAELASSYLRGTTRQVGEIGRALAAGDAAEVSRLGHGGLGSSLSCGVPGMAGLFRAIERAGEEGRLAEAGELVERTAAELERVERAFHAAEAGDLRQPDL